MLLHDLVTASADVAATASRKAKIARAGRRAGRGRGADEVATATSYLSGVLRQRRTGWAGAACALPAAAGRRADADGRARWTRRSSGSPALSGAGLARPRRRSSRGAVRPGDRRRAAVARGLRHRRAAPGRPRRRWCSRRSPGAAGVPAAAVRRAAMLRRVPGAGGAAALTGGRGGAGGVRARGRAGRCCRCWPQRARRRRRGMAEPAPARPRSSGSSTASGSRCTVAATRSSSPPASSTTSPTGCPRWSRRSRALPGARPRARRRGDRARRPTAGRGRSRRPASRGQPASTSAAARPVPLTPYFFDLLHLDGEDLLDAPGRERSAALAEARARRALRVPRLVTADPAQAAAFFDEALAAGHEGVVVKSLDAPYDAGRRGAAWVKVKPRAHPRPGRPGRRVGQRAAPGLAVQHPPRRPRPGDRRLRDARQDLQGHDRRDAAPGRPSASSSWPTARDGVGRARAAGAGRRDRLRRRAALRPATPPGAALRFARVMRYRPTRRADEADTIETVARARPGASANAVLAVLRRADCPGPRRSRPGTATRPTRPVDTAGGAPPPVVAATSQVRKRSVSTRRAAAEPGRNGDVVGQAEQRGGSSPEPGRWARRCRASAAAISARPAAAQAGVGHR